MAGSIERQAAAETKIEAMWKCVFGNGQPGLEAKLMGAIGIVRGELKAHIESVQRHGDKNMQEGDALVLQELQAEREAREGQHLENKAEQKELGKKIDRLTIVQATFAGALLAIKALEDFGFIHVAGGK
jgi:hypothetical protein